jgi:hypothetical protein
MLRKAIKEGKEPPAGTHFIYPDIETYADFEKPNPDEEIFSEFLEDEHSPENMISIEIIKRVSLRNKLRKIELERKQDGETEIDSLNIDYTNYEGK